MHTLKILSLMLLLMACGPRIERVDDIKLTGIPEAQRGPLNEARRQLALARSELEKARDAVRESEYVVQVAEASLRVARAEEQQREIEFDFATWQKDNRKIIASGEAQRAAEDRVEAARLDLDSARAARTLARARVDEAEARVTHADAEHELERARLAAEYDELRDNEKREFLHRFETVALETQLALSKKQADTRAAETSLVMAEERRKSFEGKQ